MAYKFLKDHTYNINGGWNGRRKANKGDVGDVPVQFRQSWLDRGIIEEVNPAEPKENKVVEPKHIKDEGGGPNNFQAEHVGFGNYEIHDGRGNVVEKIKGKEKAEERVKELNGG